MRRLVVLAIALLAVAAGVTAYWAGAVSHGSTVNVADDGWPVGHG
jgi:ABC-type proline/glycine betaine transport system substrate-binding protein